jgi:hypothetical protein
MGVYPKERFQRHGAKVKAFLRSSEIMVVSGVTHYNMRAVEQVV